MHEMPNVCRWFDLRIDSFIITLYIYTCVYWDPNDNLNNNSIKSEMSKESSNYNKILIGSYI